MKAGHSEYEEASASAVSLPRSVASFARGARALVLFALLFGSPVAHAGSGMLFTGKLYRLGSNRSVVLYRWVLEQCPERWKSTYTRPDGSISVEDEVNIEAGRLKRYSYHRHGTGERSSVSFDDPVARFEYSDPRSRKRKSRRIDGPFVVGPTVAEFIQSHLDELEAGKELTVRYGVLDMLDDFGFRLKLAGTDTSDGTLVQMEATSLFVRIAIDPITIAFSSDRRFLGMSGRSLPMEREDGRLKPIDAELVVESETALDCGKP